MFCLSFFFFLPRFVAPPPPPVATILKEKERTRTTWFLTGAINKFIRLYQAVSGFIGCVRNNPEDSIAAQKKAAWIFPQYPMIMRQCLSVSEKITVMVVTSSADRPQILLGTHSELVWIQSHETQTRWWKFCTTHPRSAPRSLCDTCSQHR